MIYTLDQFEHWEDMKNKIICGDALELLKKIPDKSIDLVLTDPPYGISFKSNWTTHHRDIKNDKFDDFDKLTDLLLPELQRVLTDNGCCCCCCCGGGGKTPVSQIFTLKAINYFSLIQTVIWDKKTIGLGWRYRPSYETIIVVSKSSDKYNWFTERSDVSNIIKYNNIIPQKGEHPTVKPVKLMAEFINLHSTKNMVVLDPFMGSWTTAKACQELGRDFIGCDLEMDYCKIGERRLAETPLFTV